VLDGSKYDFEHTVPASMSFDNELKNLTISDKTYNQQIKGKKLPSECPNYETDFNLNGLIYPPIIDSLQTIFGRIDKEEKIIKGEKVITYKCDRIEDLEEQYQEWKDKTSEDKEIKDNIIIKRHYLKMQLDYWRYKFQTFTIKEDKAGWRNSQLRDTQTITKYAIPYLKTVFENVEPQKGNITADFRKIYKIQPKFEKKERTKHAHHAMDAAVLTLIPPAVVRDKFLKEYNEAIDKNALNNYYHPKPLRGNNFHASHILEIENNVLINFQPDYRTLTHTYKKVRKRGKLQFVKYKGEDGKWHFKMNVNGNKIPLIAKGDRKEWQKG
jgi:CRISPR-associated endonuclease Csn1